MALKEIDAQYKKIDEEPSIIIKSNVPVEIEVIWNNNKKTIRK